MVSSWPRRASGPASSGWSPNHREGSLKHPQSPPFQLTWDPGSLTWITADTGSLELSVSSSKTERRFPVDMMHGQPRGLSSGLCSPHPSAGPAWMRPGEPATAGREGGLRRQGQSTGPWGSPGVCLSERERERVSMISWGINGTPRLSQVGHTEKNRVDMKDTGVV